MSTYFFSGTSGDDRVLTFDLAREHPSYQNFSVDGKDGDDYIFSYIGFDRSGYDEIKGGEGNDYMVGRASLSTNARSTFQGGFGADVVSFPKAEIIDINPQSSALELTVENLENGTLLTSLVAKDVEIISVQDLSENYLYYLTEDISRGELRSVDSDEYNFRTTGENADWYLNGLDTAAAYQSSLLSGQSSGGNEELTQGDSPDQIIGTKGNDKLKGKKSAIEIYGLAGNDKLIGSKGDDLLDGGSGNDKLKGKRGSDVYVLSEGSDSFKGFKMSEGDTIQIESSLEFEIAIHKKGSQLIHEGGITTVFGIDAGDLAQVIDIV